jgi:hypothetical protein
LPGLDGGDGFDLDLDRLDFTGGILGGKGGSGGFDLGGLLVGIFDFDTIEGFIEDLPSIIAGLADGLVGGLTGGLLGGWTP